MSKIVEGIKKLVNDVQLPEDHAKEIMHEIMSGNATESQIGGYLTALRIKGETVDVVSAAAEVMREFSNRIHPKNVKNLVDTCGTGGDNADTFNISTLAALVAAGAGARIAKHGNRSVSSSCGSADILEGFGAKIDSEPQVVEDMIEEIGFGFMFAPRFHPAMKYAMPTRKSLAMRTIFNILGPLTNPASANRHIMGVFDKGLTEKMAEVMKNLGADHVFVVHSEPGIDEIVPISDVYISELKNGKIHSYILGPNDFGIDNVNLDELKGGELEQNIEIAKNILNANDNGIRKKIVVINAAYALISSGIVQDLNEAIEKAEYSLTSGAAKQKLKQFVEKSGGSLHKFEQIFNQ